MTTVGFGDIVPKTRIEIVFVMFSLIILCAIFAFSFNLIGVIVQEMNKRREEFRNDM